MNNNEIIVTGKRYRVWDEATSQWKRMSFYTQAEDTAFADGLDAETKVGAINGITSSLASTSENYALSASAGRNLKSQIDNVNSNLGQKVNTSDIVNNLTSTATNKPLSAYQGRVLKSYIDNLVAGDGISGQTGESLRLIGMSYANCVYGNYNFGIYYVAGSEEGLPLTGYAGFLITLKWTTSRIIKILFLVNAYTYVMSQENDGTVVNAWVRL